MEFVDVFQDSVVDRTKNFVTKEYLDVRLMELELKLSLEIAATKNTLILWMGQLAAMFGFLYLFLKH